MVGGVVFNLHRLLFGGHRCAIALHRVLVRIYDTGHEQAKSTQSLAEAALILDKEKRRTKIFKVHAAEIYASVISALPGPPMCSED